MTDTSFVPATPTTKAETMSNAIASFDASTALRQLCQGPTGRLVMVGATNFVKSDADNYIQFSFKGCRKANKCRIMLNADDTYTLTFFKFNRKTYDCPQVHEVEGAYCDMLKDCFESFTGLYLSL